MNLAEKYRPQTLSEIRGQNQIVACLKSFIRRPQSKAFLFAGSPGTGKTSAAHCMARELGVDVDKKEWGGLHEIASGELTAENIREMFRNSMQFHTWSGSGWKALICNEADNMSDKAQFIFLDILEHLPPQTIVIFTTNNGEKLSRRFRERCECHEFKSAINEVIEAEAQGLIDYLWQNELGHNHSPRLADLTGWKEDDQISYRGIVRGLETLIRAQADIDAGDQIEATAPSYVPSGERMTAKERIAKNQAMVAAMLAEIGGEQ